MDRKPLGAAVVLPGNPNDGSIAVTFGKNDMEAWGDFKPPARTGLPITRDYIDAALAKFNITHGVLREAVENAARVCNTSKKPRTHILIAKGREPVNETAEYFERNSRLDEPREAPGRSDIVDYKDISPFVIVKKGQALAVKRPKVTGVNGVDVHGVIIPFGTLTPAGVSGGENTTTTDKFIIANINGQLVETKGTLSVKGSLEIKGPVDYRTGHIIFPGDVSIDGPVCDGFKIYSGGSVLIKQTFDVTDAVAKGDITVSGGIIGRGRALVKSGGCLKAKFIENCRAACRKSVIVETEIINSNIFTLERVEMSDKGRIVGGEIYAVHGLRAGGIGRKSGKPTSIHLGLDFAAQQEKERGNNLLRMLQAKIQQVRDALEEPETESAKRAQLTALLERLEGEQQAAQAKVAGLLDKINIDENAAAEVTGEIAPETLIEICQVALFVTEPLRKVRIRLNKERGGLITEPL
jgi:uncharacterized protein (DUF342 family)